MAHYADTQAHPFTELLLTKVARLLEQAAERRAHARAYHEAVRELRTLSTRELDDLGLNRSMIKSVAMEAADQRVKK
ncbi:MAG: DUF1127 domain-containing protein [Roseobacter sp.]|nr:DUF1127 domain-containing protein [Roseobacter sp.]